MLFSFLGIPKGFFVQYDYISGIVPIAEYPGILTACQQADLKPVFNQLPATAEAVKKDPDFWNRNTNHLGPLDSAINYTITRLTKPSRILEIGCGRSTEILARAVMDGGLDARITCIDPAPRLDISNLPVQFERRLLQLSDADLVSTLEPNDMLYIDSSHILQPGSDVDLEFNILFPVLKSGVIVHVHDIHLPWGYDTSWNDKNWNEACGLMPWILSGAFEIVFPVRYAQVVHEKELIETMPDYLGPKLATGGSMWLRKK